jgi:hypothetical protein
MSATTSKASASGAESQTSESANGGPIIVDMGKGSRKQIRKLRKGKPGKLLSRIEETLEHLRESGSLAGDGQAVVIVLREKREPRRIGKALGFT